MMLIPLGLLSDGDDGAIQWRWRPRSACDEESWRCFTQEEEELIEALYEHEQLGGGAGALSITPDTIVNISLLKIQSGRYGEVWLERQRVQPGGALGLPAQGQAAWTSDAYPPEQPTVTKPEQPTVTKQRDSGGKGKQGVGGEGTGKLFQLPRLERVFDGTRLYLNKVLPPGYLRAEGMQVEVEGMEGHGQGEGRGGDSPAPPVVAHMQGGPGDPGWAGKHVKKEEEEEEDEKKPLGIGEWAHYGLEEVGLQDLILPMEQGGLRLHRALLTSFGDRVASLVPLFPAHTAVTFICDYKPHHPLPSTSPPLRLGLPPHWSVVHPPFPAWQCHPVGPTFHPKLWLLDYGLFLRIVISSANAGRWEWASVTQNIWVLDAKPRHTPHADDDPRDSDSEFQRELTDFVMSMLGKGKSEQWQGGVGGSEGAEGEGVWEEEEAWQRSEADRERERRRESHATVQALARLWAAVMDRYDITPPPEVHLVASSPWLPPEQNALHKLRARLGPFLRKWALNNGQEGGAKVVPRFDQVFFQMSSIGEIKHHFVDMFEKAVHGRINLIWPTEEQARRPDVRGRAALFLSGHKTGSTWWKSLGLQDDGLCHLGLHASRSHCLNHSKVMVGIKEGLLAFVYAGSHNLSPAAWGTVPKDISDAEHTSTPFCPESSESWELGVLLLNPPQDMTLPFHLPSCHRYAPAVEGQGGDVPYTHCVASRVELQDRVERIPDIVTRIIASHPAPIRLLIVPFGTLFTMSGKLHDQVGRALVQALAANLAPPNEDSDEEDFDDDFESPSDSEGGPPKVRVKVKIAVVTWMGWEVAKRTYLQQSINNSDTDSQPSGQGLKRRLGAEGPDRLTHLARLLSPRERLEHRRRIVLQRPKELLSMDELRRRVKRAGEDFATAWGGPIRVGFSYSDHTDRYGAEACTMRGDRGWGGKTREEGPDLRFYVAFAYRGGDGQWAAPPPGVPRKGWGDEWVRPKLDLYRAAMAEARVEREEQVMVVYGGDQEHVLEYETMMQLQQELPKVALVAGHRLLARQRDEHRVGLPTDEEGGDGDEEGEERRWMQELEEEAALQAWDRGLGGVHRPLLLARERRGGTQGERPFAGPG